VSKIKSFAGITAPYHNPQFGWLKLKFHLVSRTGFSSW